MEGTMNNSQNKTMDEIICDLAEVVLGALNVSNNLRTLNEKEFAGDGEDVTDKLPSMTEALKLREENEKLKEENERRGDAIGKGVFVIEKLKEEAVELRAQIPDKKNKKLSKNDKMILRMIADDVFALSENQPDDEDYLPGGMSYQHHPEKKALLLRLLK